MRKGASLYRERRVNIGNDVVFTLSESNEVCLTDGLRVDRLGSLFLQRSLSHSSWF